MPDPRTDSVSAELCGEHTLSATIGWGERTTFYASNHDGLAVCCSRSRLIIDIQRFLRSASEQQVAVSTGCRRIAPIIDFGVTSTGRAYKISLSYSASLADCIRYGNITDGDDLKRIVSGVLQSLSELSDKCHRAHGNLTAGNILLNSGGEIAISDLAPRANDATHVSDLHALGRVIYQLVRRTINVGFLNPPLEASTAWVESLGESADNWRAFTNLLLLQKPGNEQKALGDALRSLKSLDSLGEDAPPVAVASTISTGKVSATSQTPRKRKKTLPVLLCGVLGFGALGGFIWNKNRTAKQVIPEVAPKVFFDAKLLKESLPKNDSLSSAAKSIAARLSGATTLSEAEGLFREWSGPAELKKISEDWSARGSNWKRLSELLSAKVDLSDGGGESTDAERLDRIMNAVQAIDTMDKALAEAASLNKSWDKLSLTCSDIDNLAVPGLPRFVHWAEMRVTTANNLAGAILIAEECTAKLAEVRSLLAAEKSRISRASFEAKGKEIGVFRPEAIDVKWPDKWLEAVRESLRPDQITLMRWQAEFTKIKEGIQKSPQSERSGLIADLAKLEVDEKGVLDSGKEAFSSRIVELKKRLRNPVQELDTKFYKLFADFQRDISNATTDQAKDLLAAFTSNLTGLSTSQDAQAAKVVFAHYGFDLGTNKLGELKEGLLAAVGKRDLPIFPAAFLARWKPDGEATENSARFLHRASNFPMTFHVIPKSDPRVALAALETPLRLARAVQFTPEPGTGPLGNLNTGPNAAQKWLWPGINTWLNAVKERTKYDEAKLLPRGNEDPEDCPVTWIAPFDAQTIAMNLGGRLPKVTEWKAAHSAQAQGLARLIGDTFQQVSREVSLQAAVGARPSQVANPGIFERQLPPGPATDKANVTVDDLGILWLTACVAPQGKDFGTLFSHLIGNAAEFVSDGAGGFAYIGGSCVTRKESSVLTPVRVTNTKGFDIGFRLAVDLEPNLGIAGRDALKAAVDAQIQSINSRRMKF